MKAWSWGTFTVSVWLLVAPPTASADGSPYRLQWGMDIGIAAVAGTGWVVPELLRARLVQPSCPCSARQLNPLDRASAGTRRAGVATLSDVGIGLVYVLGFGLDALDLHAVPESALADYLIDAVVLAETLAISGALAELAKVAAARPRPLVYGLAESDPRLRDPGNYVSFYSAHTSGAFAFGLAFAQTFARRHADPLAIGLVYAGAVLLGATIGSLRVLSGEHFPSDVLAGAVIGSGVGLLVPWLHQRTGSARLVVGTRPAGVQLIVSLDV